MSTAASPRLLAIALAALLTLGVQLDGPTDTEAVQASAADQQDADALASRDFVLQQVCGAAGGEWLDDQTLSCHGQRATVIAEAGR